MAQNISQFLLFVSIYILSMLLMICKLTYSANLLAQFCSNDTMFANNSQYQADLSTVFRYLTSNATNPTGYHSAISPSSDDTTNEAVYGHFLCLGDQNTSSCHDCVTTATTTDLPTKCPRRKDAIIWYDECLVRYSNHSFFGAMDEWPSMLYWNVNSILNNETRFMELMRSMMNDEIAVRAATGGSQKKFAVDYVNNTVFQTIYGLGQCTPDLSSSDCNTCLVNGVAGLRATQGGRILQPSCVVRYEVYPFFDSSYLPPPSPPPPPPPPPPSQPPPPLQPPTPTDNFRRSNGNGSDKAKLAILITVPAVGLIAVAVGFSFFCCRKKRKGNRTETSLSIHQDENDESASLVSLLFRFDTIKVATDNFSDANKLGRGGFGTVYKGTLKNGQEVAVKRLSTDSGQGDGEFKTEVLLVAKLQHRNLVKLLGFCIERKERILIYEFVPNTSLDNFLFDTTKRSKLSWQNRYKIIAGIARGLLYLHEDSRLRIIHRDLKASNILLDANMNPKIADFGIARLFGVDQSQGDTNRIVGTYGYMAPEYALHGLFSIKSDVFSFGVLVLEIITGRKSRGSATQEQAEDLLSFVWRNWRDGTTLHIIDQTLASTRSGTEIMRCIQMGLLCVQENAEDRPTMSFVLLMLSSHSLKLPVPSHPAFVTQTASIGLHWKSDNTNRTLKITSANSMCEDSITDLYPH